MQVWELRIKPDGLHSFLTSSSSLATFSRRIHPILVHVNIVRGIPPHKPINKDLLSKMSMHKKKKTAHCFIVCIAFRRFEKFKLLQLLRLSVSLLILKNLDILVAISFDQHTILHSPSTITRNGSN